MSYSLARQTPSALPLPHLLHSLQNGSLLPCSSVTPLVQHLLEVSLPRYLLDGYPRTASQARSLFQDFPLELRPDLVLLLETDDEHVLRERMRRRARVDDDHDVADRRLRDYENGLAGILDVIGSNGGRIVKVECGDRRHLLEERVKEATKGVDKVVVIGPPAAGKGVVGEAIGQPEGRIVISVGDVLRRLAVKLGTESFKSEGLKMLCQKM